MRSATQTLPAVQDHLTSPDRKSFAFRAIGSHGSENGRAGVSPASTAGNVSERSCSVFRIASIIRRPSTARRRTCEIVV
jgi:hypothetical protein